MMAVAGSLQLSHELGIHKNHKYNKQFQNMIGSGRLRLLGTNFSSLALQQDSWSILLSKRVHRPMHSIPNRCTLFNCHSLVNPGQPYNISCMKNAAFALTRACNGLQSSPFVLKLVPAIGIVVFAIWGIGPLMRQSRNIFLHKNDNSWRKSSTYYVMTSYLQPLLLWTGATLICRILDPVVLPSEASQIVKQRLLNFVRSLSTVLAFAYCLSCVIQQAQKFFMETNDPIDTRNMGFQFAGKAVYSAVWVAAVSLFMELLGFSTQKWLTAGGLGTVLLTLAGREIFTNFLSSAMIHATRPFVVNEWIQTKIEGYEVSGTVEHVGWWSPTIVRGEDREAVHIPNHKFTVNVVRNLSQKTHWRIKTHLAISHLDVNKINNIVADMRKVLAKNPQVEQQKLHRRVFLDNIDRENQALLILVSCFVKTSHFEEYLCVKEAILLDLLRVIRHHRARLATPIRTVQKIYSDTDLDSIPFAESAVTQGAASNRALLLIEPPYKINGEERTKTQTRSVRTIGEQDNKAAIRPTPDNKAEAKAGTTVTSDSKVKETQSWDSKAKEIPRSDLKAEAKVGERPNPSAKDDYKVASTSISDTKLGDEVTVSVSKTDTKFAEVSSYNSKVEGSVSENSTQSISNKTDTKFAEVVSYNSKVEAPVSENSTQTISNKKQPKSAGQGTAWQRSMIGNSSASLPETGGEKTGSSLSTSQLKQEDDKLLFTQPHIPKPALEENIVLGVALEGSKRTLPIDEGMVSPSTQAERKKLASCSSKNGNGSGNGSPSAEKDKKDCQNSSVSSWSSGDQKG